MPKKDGTPATEEGTGGVTKSVARGGTAVQKTPKRSVGRPPATEAEIAAKRRQIIEGAFAVFTRQGYQDSGIADIAAEVGTGHGTIYRYFENKREVLDHVIASAATEMAGWLDADDISMASAANFRASTTRLGNSLFDHVAASDGSLIRMLLVEAPAVDHEMSQRVNKIMNSLIAATSTVLDAAQRAGYVDSHLHAEAAARALVGGVTTGLLALLHEPGLTARQRREYVETLVVMVCGPADAPVRV